MKESPREKVTVLGSFVVDLMARTPRLPLPGETVRGTVFGMGPGGKGFNQAVAAHKAGAHVTAVIKLGHDYFGEIACNTMEELNMDKQYVCYDDQAKTGIALISVHEESCQNEIIVVPGACDTFNAKDLCRAETVIKDSAYLLLQLEVNEEANEEAARMARKYGCRVILNPAPCGVLSEKLLRNVDIITPNETEACGLTSISITDMDSCVRAAQKLHDMGIPGVVITLGEKGAFFSYEGIQKLVPPYCVKAVDTTGAGDAFHGGMVTALAEGKTMEEAVGFGNAVAALSVGKMGTTPSMPERKQVELFIEHIAI